MMYDRDSDEEKFVKSYNIEELEWYCRKNPDYLNKNLCLTFYSLEKPFNPYAFANVEKIKFLKEKGFPFITSNTSIPPFFNNILENVKCFVKEFDFDINTIDEKGENMAFSCNRYDTMLYLLKNNINLMVVNKKGMTLAENLTEDMFKVVFEYEPKIILANNKPLELFKKFSSTKKLTVLNKLKTEKIFDYNELDENGANILFYCLDDKKLLKAVLDLPDLNLEVKNKHGNDVLSLSNNAECAKMLVAKGKNFNSEELAAIFNSYKKVSKLTKKYAKYAFLYKQNDSYFKELEILKNEYKTKIEDNKKLSNKRTFF